jgi:murein DD-endopeptidase
MKAVLLLLICFAGQLLGQTPGRSLEGSWHGTIDVGQKLRLVLTVSRSPDGAYSGKVDSLDQGSSIPIEIIKVSGDAVRVELQSIGAVFEGKLNADGSELTGQFSQGGTSFPLTFKRGASTPATAPTPPALQRPLDIPVEVVVPAPPTAFKGGGKTHVVYELHITNFSRTACVLTRLEAIRNDSQEKVVAGYDGDELGKHVVRPGIAATTTEDKLKLGPGLRMIVHVWLTFGTPAETPTSIQHRLSFKVGDYAEVLSSDFAPTAVAEAPVLISPPLRGAEWLSANGPSNTSGHRRALIPTAGRARIAQRFAIDFVQLREDGRTFTGDQKDNRNYRCYGAEVLAVADGKVVGTKDGIPENVPGPASRAVPITLETVGGNYVILDLGHGRFAFYAHLQPGSLRVKPGETVRRGQVLGLVGNSGNSTEPHLHFHVANANSPLASEGIPFGFRAFEVQGKGWGWKAASANPTTEKRQNEIPLELEVVRFPPEQ